MKFQRVLLHCKRERIVSDVTERMTTVPILLAVILAVKGEVCIAYDGMVIDFGILCRCTVIPNRMEF